ncbi:MAG: DUF1565 domain-containing protein [Elainellaceae cyanobacterium]
MGLPITHVQTKAFSTAHSLSTKPKPIPVKSLQPAAVQRIQHDQQTQRWPQSVLLALSLLAGTALSLAIATPAQAEQIDRLITQNHPIITAQATPAAPSYLFINPIQGNDSGAGTQASPLRSLTQALSQAEAGTTIVLAPGTYSEETGEQFPIRLKPGVTVEGRRDQHGDGIVIRGGGSFLSPTAARQNITVLAVSQASLIGVTVTNPNSRGYGVWVESSNPTLAYNTLRDNIHDGIAVNGASAPLIQHNLFLNNGTNGVSVFGRSSPRIQQNVFHQTGYGIYIGDEAEPTVVSNRIVNNRSGVIVQEQARPVLRNNLIEGNQQNGVVAIAQALPDLGTPESPGQNQFAQNGEADINADVAHYPVIAVGNQFAQQRLIGSVDLTGTMPLAAAQGATPLPLESGTVTLAASSSTTLLQASPQSNDLSSNTSGAPRLPELDSLTPTPSTRPVSTEVTETLNIATPGSPTALASSPLNQAPPTQANEPSTRAIPVLPAPSTLAATPPTQVNTAAIAAAAATATAPSSQANPTTTNPTTAAAPSAPAQAASRPSSRFPQPSASSSQPSRTPGRNNALAIEEFVEPSSIQRAASVRFPAAALSETAATPSSLESSVAASSPAATAPPESSSALQPSSSPSAQTQRLLSQLTAIGTASSAGSSNDAQITRLETRSDFGDPEAEDAVEIRVIDPPAAIGSSRPAPSASRQTSRANAALLSLLPSQGSQSDSMAAEEGIPIRVLMPSETTVQPRLTTIAAAQNSSPPSQPQAAPRPTIRPRNQNLLPVPTADVPYGHVGNRSRISVGSNPLANRIGPGAGRIQMLGLRYRVLVEANGRDAEMAVRSLAPGAFRTNLNGRSLMQAGAYSSLENANDMARQLAGRGLRTEVQQMQ